MKENKKLESALIELVPYYRIYRYENNNFNKLDHRKILLKKQDVMLIKKLLKNIKKLINIVEENVKKDNKNFLNHTNHTLKIGFYNDSKESKKDKKNIECKSLEELLTDCFYFKYENLIQKKIIEEIKNINIEYKYEVCPLERRRLSFTSLEQLIKESNLYKE